MNFCDTGWKEEHWQKEKRSSQRRDPRTVEGNSQGGDPSTLEDRSHQAKRWRVRKKRKVKHRKRTWWSKCEELNTSGNPPRDAAKMVRTTIRRVSVGGLRIKLVGIWSLKGFRVLPLGEGADFQAKKWQGLRVPVRDAVATRHAWSVSVAIGDVT